MKADKWYEEWYSNNVLIQYKEDDGRHIIKVTYQDNYEQAEADTRADAIHEGTLMAARLFPEWKA